MALRSRSRKLSFDILSASSTTSFDDDDYVESLLHRTMSDPLTRGNGEATEVSASQSKPSRRKRKNRGAKKKRTFECSISEDSVLDDPKHGVLENGSCRGELEVNCKSYRVQSVVCEEFTIAEETGGSVCTVRPVREAEFKNVQNSEGYLVGELRQRSVAGSGGGGSEVAVSRSDESVAGSGGGGSEVAVSRGDESVEEEHGGKETESLPGNNGVNRTAMLLGNWRRQSRWIGNG